MDTIPVIGIHGAPRSGTSWLGQILNSHPAVKYCYQPFFSYAFRGRANLSICTKELRDLFAEMRASDDDFINQTGSSQLAKRAPLFIKDPHSHLIYKEVRFHHLLAHFLRILPEFKAIGIVRDPRSVLASWFNAPREFDISWGRKLEWRDAPLKNQGLDENWYGFTRWIELSKLFLNLQDQYAGRFILIRYEDLVENPCFLAQRLLNFCGLDLTRQTLEFIDTSSTTNDGDPYGVFRSGMRNLSRFSGYNLEPEISSQIEKELFGTPLEQFLLKAAG